MRSAIKLLLPALLAAALCACGNYSNDDLVFLSAIPSREQLRVAVPKAAGQALCSLGEDTYATGAQKQGKGVNDAIDSILGLVDLIRTIPATRRDGDSRTWGPWRDGTFTNVEYVVTIIRARGATPAADKFDYTFSGRRDGGAWVNVLSGEFNGTQAKHGTGSLRLDLEGSWKLGTNKPGDAHAAFKISYTLGAEPRTITLEATAAPGFGLLLFDYAWAGYADGRALFTFRFGADDNSGNVFTVDARFSPQGDGRASITGQAPSGANAHIDTCFDGQACITFLDDIHGFTPACGGHAFCKLGSQSACPANTP